MADEDGSLALLLYNNQKALAEAIQRTGVEGGAAEALQTYGNLVHDVLVDLCGLKEFSHVEFLELGSSYKSGEVVSPLALVVGAPLKSDEGELLGVSDVSSVLDLYGLLTGSRPFPEVMVPLVGMDDDGMLGFTDEATDKLATKYSKRLKLDARFPDVVPEDREASLAEALGELLPADSGLTPVHPEDLLLSLPVFMSHAAGAPASTGARGPGVLQRGRQLVGRLMTSPRFLLQQAGKKSRWLRHNIWRLEDLAITSGKVALRVAHKAVRPVLVAYVLHRTLTALEASNTLPVRMSKLPRPEAVDLYYKTLLGEDFGKQMEQDLLDAVKEVEEGLVTEDYKDEKRLLSAAMLRRLEVEEWDKERMKHFYLGSYGLGPWYFDMEERLHNAYFMGARGWNGPVESWVGKNKTYTNDVPLQGNPDEFKLAAIESALGRHLTTAQRQRVLKAGRPQASDLLTAKGGLLDGVLDKETVRQHVAAVE